MGVMYPQERDEMFKQKVKLFILRVIIGTVLIIMFGYVGIPIIATL